MRRKASRIPDIKRRRSGADASGSARARAYASATPCLMNYFDDLETRNPRCASAPVQGTEEQLDNAKKNAPYFAESLKDVRPHEVKDRAALARLPVTRKAGLDRAAEGPPAVRGDDGSPGRTARPDLRFPGTYLRPPGRQARLLGHCSRAVRRGVFAGGADIQRLLVPFHPGWLDVRPGRADAGLPGVPRRRGPDRCRCRPSPSSSPVATPARRRSCGSCWRRPTR